MNGSDFLRELDWTANSPPGVSPASIPLLTAHWQGIGGALRAHSTAAQALPASSWCACACACAYPVSPHVPYTHTYTYMSTPTAAAGTAVPSTGCRNLRPPVRKPVALIAPSLMQAPQAPWQGHAYTHTHH